jgi:hypothetical protein
MVATQWPPGARYRLRPISRIKIFTLPTRKPSPRLGSSEKNDSPSRQVYQLKLVSDRDESLIRTKQNSYIYAKTQRCRGARELTTDRGTTGIMARKSAKNTARRSRNEGHSLSSRQWREERAGERRSLFSESRDTPCEPFGVPRLRRTGNHPDPSPRRGEGIHSVVDLALRRFNASTRS